MTILVLEEDQKNIKYYWQGRSWSVEDLVNEIEYTRAQVEGCLNKLNEK